MREEGLESWFTLVGLKVKPIATPEGATTEITVRGYKHGEGEEEEEEEVEWHIDFPSGYHEVFEVKMREYSRENWKRLVGVEVTADYGVDRLDWEFCVDDLVAEFTEVGDAGGEGGKGTVGEKGAGQVVLLAEYVDG